MVIRMRFSTPAMAGRWLGLTRVVHLCDGVIAVHPRRAESASAPRRLWASPARVR
jgi:hypothetical protein